MSWNKHISNILASVNKKLDIMLALKYKLDRRTLEIMYFSFIRPLLEYADIIWDNCGTVLSEKVERTQAKAAKIVSGAIIRAPYVVLLQELG